MEKRQDVPFAVRLLNGAVNIFAVCEIELMLWGSLWKVRCRTWAPVNIYSSMDYADAYNGRVACQWFNTVGCYQKITIDFFFSAKNCQGWRGR